MARTSWPIGLRCRRSRRDFRPRPSIVFPLRVNRWGWLAPLAAIALLLAERRRPQPGAGAGAASARRAGGGRGPAPGGVRTRDAGNGRSATSCHAAPGRPREIERLGARMESGALSRGEALGQLAPDWVNPSIRSGCRRWRRQHSLAAAIRDRARAARSARPRPRA